ncbi:MAG: MarR family transcriptional regulator [Chitinophagales bacterium]|nr:MarR family transcriptional regulator [Chitinophagales bacterium]MDW8417928.1 MarR family transcriptional regulator [Chitinophagales bacterium]
MSTIEELIRQKSFPSEQYKAIIHLLYTGNWVYNQSATRLKKFGITPEQFNVLRILRGSHPTPLMLQDITNRMIHKSSNATRLVEKLRLKGLVTREICPTNRRQVDITITAKGLQLLARIDEDQKEWPELHHKITRHEARELNRILEKLRS